LTVANPDAQAPDLRQALLDALVSAWVQRYGTTEPAVAGALSTYSEHALTHEDRRVAIAVYTGRSNASVQDDEVYRQLSLLEPMAAANCLLSGAYVDHFVAHLEAIGCTPAEVPEYLRLRDQVLASLYLLLQRPNPSPDAMRRLALRFALDTRRPIEGDLSRFRRFREERYWQIAEEPNELVLAEPIKNAQAAAVLDYVFTDPPQIMRLTDLIEHLLHKVPTAEDALPRDSKPLFQFSITQTTDGPHVRLWINRKEVTLRSRDAVHKLLQRLCRQPDQRLAGRELERKLQISNVSQTVHVIREALEATHRGAGQWLQTDPLGWVDGHAPEERV
jgi:hypothetical protein